MIDALGQFHFLRPLWLLAIIPALLLSISLWLRKSSAANWRSAIAPELLDHLLESTQQIRPRWPWLLLAGWMGAALALAGPTWEKLPQPVVQKRDGLVVVLDLSLSMYAEDIKPSRLERARFKVIDILQQRHEGLTGLVVYSGDAHVVSPLTDDTATIENLVPALAPAIMPSFGSNVIAGVDSALQLLHNSGFERGHILLLSDEIADSDINAIADRVDGKHWRLSIIGVGTEQGAPIPLPAAESQGGFLKQGDGTIAVAQLHRERLQKLASTTNGIYNDIQIDDSDIASALNGSLIDTDTVRAVEREFDQWRERGPQLVMLLLPLAAFAFRRGWLLVIFLVPLSSPSQALEWRDLWQRPDQQAQQDFNAGNSKAAAEKFADPKWRGAAQYRSGEYEAASETLKAIDTDAAHYNRGNALAQAGKLEEAIAAYDAALQKNPADKDAKSNRDLVEKILQQQKQQKSSQQSDQKQDKSQDENSAQKNQSPSNQEHQNSSRGDSQNSAQQSARDAQQSSTQQDNATPNSEKGNSSSPSNTAEQKNIDANESGQAQKSSPTEKSARDSADRTQTARSQDESAQKNAQQQAAAKKLTPEQQLQQRATEQWLRQVPDDPSGLLRRKFRYESQQRDQQPRDNGKPIW